jgi:hypothetical protein
MKIYRPVKTNLITQSFGLAGTSKTLLPLYNEKGLNAHDGIDFAVKCRDNQVKTGGQCENVYCSIAGVGDLEVYYIQKSVEYGFGVTLQDSQGNKYLWWHEDSFDPLVIKGQKIKFGQLLGVAGNTGMSTGAHVHFGYYPYNEPYDNGYLGASDPMPYFDNRFCLDIKSQIEIIQKVVELYRAMLSFLK